MPDNASRRGAVDLGMPLMVVAFAVIGGFMYWLNGQAANERALQIVEDTATVDDGASGGANADLGEVEGDPSGFVGTELRFAGYEVVSQLGTQGFWLSAPSGNPFLIAMTESVMAEGVTATQGDTVTVLGTIHAMSDSTLDAWTAGGTIGDTDRIVAEFAEYYMNAVAVNVTGSAGGGGG